MMDERSVKMACSCCSIDEWIVCGGSLVNQLKRRATKGFEGRDSAVRYRD